MLLGKKLSPEPTKFSSFLAIGVGFTRANLLENGLLMSSPMLVVAKLEIWPS
jgi:hypothetical protein